MEVIHKAAFIPRCVCASLYSDQKRTPARIGCTKLSFKVCVHAEKNRTIFYFKWTAGKLRRVSAVLPHRTHEWSNVLTCILNVNGPKLCTHHPCTAWRAHRYWCECDIKKWTQTGFCPFLCVTIICQHTETLFIWFIIWCMLFHVVYCLVAIISHLT